MDILLNYILVGFAFCFLIDFTSDKLKYHSILAAVEHDFKGYNIKNGEYVDMVKEGIIDPTKVTRTALENAVSVAGTMLITECTIVDDPKEDKEVDPMSMMGM